MAHYVIGTSGHIDHGKTTLTHALTGIFTDRLKEERERGVSIELGFAPLPLPDGKDVSVIDVPGHERFIRHMVSGVAGVDLILLVIAADESVMPQTLEHLHILDLLGLKRGVIVVNKVDLVEPDFLDLVEEEIRETIKDTFLRDAPFSFVSAKTGQGLAELKQLISDELNKVSARSQEGAFRLPIDRSFTLKGIGTVVTGTAYNGTIRVGDEMEWMPAERSVRVRGLQVHGKSVNEAYAGQRIAVNLTQVEWTEIERGDLLVTPDYWRTTDRLDVELALLPNLDFPIKQRTMLRLHMGTREVMCHLILFDRKELQPGETAFAQLILEEPVISSREERFILRRPSPALTVGGGRVIDPYAKKMKIRSETADILQQKSEGTVSERLVHWLEDSAKIWKTAAEASEALTIPIETLINEIKQLAVSKEILLLPRSVSQEEVALTAQTFVQTSVQLKEWKQKLHLLLEEVHRQSPLKFGVSMAELHQRLMPSLPFKTFQQWIHQYMDSLELKESGTAIALRNFSLSPPVWIQNKIAAMENELKKDIYNPVKWESFFTQHQIDKKWQTDLFHYLLERKFWYRVSDEEALYGQAFEEAKPRIIAYLKEKREMSIQDARELLDLSRKKLVALLDLMDAQQITDRKENIRTLKNES